MFQDCASGGEVIRPSSPENACGGTTAVSGTSQDTQSGETVVSDSREELRRIREAQGVRVIDLNNEQLEQVRAAMANVVLPPSSIPDWAMATTDEEWHQRMLQIIYKLDNKQQHDIPKT
ncbi:hypothetical protein L9F63_010187 [Diploptera punctata]|uniref:Male-enhanced antigen 1 n=1 Tax=Diploptera punctata TaxID=6984 RepID=A0AAD8EQD8_DIPPU|nr:hypothetical protein L9F63_010187 [Diploptera punctata]